MSLRLAPRGQWEVEMLIVMRREPYPYYSVLAVEPPARRLGRRVATGLPNWP
ncbi:MAG: hypothetical protein GX621_03970 [Pirellulaceae bacterium]|nr:hypothetical protein [Pirellulaceae bacterium]